MIDHFTPERRSQALGDIRPDDPTTFRPAMRLFGIPIARISRETGLGYSRLEKILNGRAKARPDEAAVIARALGIRA